LAAFLIKAGYSDPLVKEDIEKDKHLFLSAEGAPG
jgi:hypothetical protein